MPPSPQHIVATCRWKGRSCSWASASRTFSMWLPFGSEPSRAPSSSSNRAHHKPTDCSADMRLACPSRCAAANTDNQVYYHDVDLHKRIRQREVSMSNYTHLRQHDEESRLVWRVGRGHLKQLDEGTPLDTSRPLQACRTTDLFQVWLLVSEMEI